MHSASFAVSAIRSPAKKPLLRMLECVNDAPCHAKQQPTHVRDQPDSGYSMERERRSTLGRPVVPDVNCMFMTSFAPCARAKSSSWRRTAGARAFSDSRSSNRCMPATRWSVT